MFLMLHINVSEMFKAMRYVHNFLSIYTDCEEIMQKLAKMYNEPKYHKE